MLGIWKKRMKIYVYHINVTQQTEGLNWLLADSLISLGFCWGLILKKWPAHLIWIANVRIYMLKCVLVYGKRFCDILKGFPINPWLWWKFLNEKLKNIRFFEKSVCKIFQKNSYFSLSQMSEIITVCDALVPTLFF